MHTVGLDPSSRISSGVNGVHRRMYGRGAQRARTVVHDGLVVCFMEDMFTSAERTLIDAGSFELVQAARARFQEIAEPELSAIVEEACGRQVVAFLSQVRANPDVGIEAFVLARD